MRFYANKCDCGAALVIGGLVLRLAGSCVMQALSTAKVPSNALSCIWFRRPGDRAT